MYGTLISQLKLARLLDFDRRPADESGNFSIFAGLNSCFQLVFSVCETSVAISRCYTKSLLFSLGEGERDANARKIMDGQERRSRRSARLVHP